MKKPVPLLYLVAAIFLLPRPFLDAREKVDRDLLSQSRSQESVGRSVQSAVADLESLLDDLESNGLIEESMIEKMRTAQKVLNSIGEENIPAATAKLKAAALGVVGRSDNLLQANSEVEGILNELKKTARGVGNQQKRSAYGQLLSQLLSQNEELQDQTRKWGEEQLTDPSRSDETRDGVREKQSEMEAQFDALKDMLDREIASQEDSDLQNERQDLLDALEGKEAEGFDGIGPQDFAESNLAETPNQPFSETGDFAQTPQASTQPEGDNPPEKPGENGKPEAPSSRGENQEKEGFSKDASDSKTNESSAQKALEESGNAIMANDAGSALSAQKEFQEILANAIGSMSSAMAENLQPEAFPQTNSQMSSSPMASPSLSSEPLDPFADMAFGSESKGSEVGEAELEALLSGEDPNAGSQEGSGGGTEAAGEQTAGGEQQTDGEQSAVASANPSAGVPSPSPMGGQQPGESEKTQGPPGSSNPGAPSPGKGGAPQTSSMQSSNPFAPPSMTPGAGAPGEGSGTATASFDKPHGTHYETTAIKGGGGPAKGNYEKTEQSRRNLAEVVRQKIQQDYQRRLPAEYRIMTAEYFELLGSLEE